MKYYVTLNGYRTNHTVFLTDNWLGKSSREFAEARIFDDPEHVVYAKFAIRHKGTIWPITDKELFNARLGTGTLPHESDDKVQKNK